MARKIFKYEIPPPVMGTVTTVSVPKGAKILHYGTQRHFTKGEGIYFWAEVDPNREDELMAFQVIPTGGNVPEMTSWLWAVTVQFVDDPIVFHVYREWNAN